MSLKAKMPLPTRMIFEVLSILICRGLGALWSCATTRIVPQLESAIENKLQGLIQDRVEQAITRRFSVAPVSAPAWSDIGDPE